MTLVASALAGGECIDDADVVAHRGDGLHPGQHGQGAIPPGTFLRSFSWGHVRQLDRVSRELLARAWQAGAGPGDGPADHRPRFHHLRDLRSGQGGRPPPRLYRQAGLPPAGGHRRRHRRRAEVPAARGPGQHRPRRRPLPAGDGGTGALRRGQRTTHLRADSGFYTHGVVSVCRKMDVRFSITIRQHKSCAISSRRYPRRTGTPIPYWMDGAADVAETTRTPFQSEPDAAPVRLIVRRVKPTPGSQLALFASYSYHGFITDRDGKPLELEADHRRHAEVENAIRDLKYGVGLNHLPSGRFAANGAWLAVQVMAHNLARWTARIGLGEQVGTTKTLRAAVLLPGRTAHPLGAPPHSASATALALGGAVQPRPGPIARPATPCLTAPSATGRHQATERPRELAPVRSASASCCVLSPLSRPHQHSQTVTKSPRATEDRHRPPLPQIVPGPSPSLAPIARSGCCIVIPSGGFGPRLRP